MNKIKEAQEVTKLYRKMYKSKNKNDSFYYYKIGCDEVCRFIDHENRIYHLYWDGTSDLNEAIGNFKGIPRKKAYKGKVHKNFYNVHRMFWKQLDQVYNFIKQNNYKLVLAGVSRGGPQSILAAIYINTKYTEPIFIDVFTFGAPRCLNSDACKYFESLDIELTQVKHYGDVVPKIPYKWLGFDDIKSKYTIYLGKKRNRIFRFIPFAKTYSTIEYHTSYTDEFIKNEIEINLYENYE